MRALILGGSGFIGQALSRYLAADGHEVTVLLRSPQKAGRLPAGVGFMAGDPSRPGSGRQWFSWIHLADLMAIFSFILKHPEISGPVNCAAPEAVTNDDLTRELGRVLKRPALISTPGWLLRLLLGEMSTLALEGTRMIPGVLSDKGFLFRFPTLGQALVDLLAQDA